MTPISFAGIHKVPMPTSSKEALAAFRQAIAATPENIAYRKLLEEKENTENATPLGEHALVAWEKLMPVVEKLYPQSQAVFKNAQQLIDDTLKKLNAEGAKKVIMTPDEAGEHFIFRTDDDIAQVKNMSSVKRPPSHDFSPILRCSFSETIGN